eukprot:UN22562
MKHQIFFQFWRYDHDSKYCEVPNRSEIFDQHLVNNDRFNGYLWIFSLCHDYVLCSLHLNQSIGGKQRITRHVKKKFSAGESHILNFCKMRRELSSNPCQNFESF